MPHIIRTCETQEAIRSAGQQRPPFGPGFTADQTKIAAKLVVTGSSFSDPGDDWVRFDLLDTSGKRIATRTIGGY
jgi:hypothetical protein